MVKLFTEVHKIPRYLLIYYKVSFVEMILLRGVSGPGFDSTSLARLNMVFINHLRKSDRNYDQVKSLRQRK